MGTQSSIAQTVRNYKIEYASTLLPDHKPLSGRRLYNQKGKVIRVEIVHGKVETILCEDPLLTVGWLLSEVTRRYNDYFSINSLTRK